MRDCQKEKDNADDHARARVMPCAVWRGNVGCAEVEVEVEERVSHPLVLQAFIKYIPGTEHKTGSPSVQALIIR
jgi:hypothetical protein